MHVTPRVLKAASRWRYSLELGWMDEMEISIDTHLFYEHCSVKENLKTKSNPPRAECDEATNPKSCRIWVISWECIEQNLLVWEDDDPGQEGGVEQKKEDRHPRLQISRLLSPTVAPQRDGY